MFNTVVYIPSQEKQWRVKPYSTSHQKEVCKALYEENEELFINITNEILEECIHPSHNYKELTVIDKLFILLKLRCVAVGPTADFETEKDNKKYNINYDFYNIYTSLYKISVNIKPLKITLNNFEIQCYIPNINQEYILYNILKEDNVTYKDILYSFINYIKINNQYFYIRDLTRDIQLQLIDNLPLNIVKDIELYIADIISQFNNLIIYRLPDTEVSFSFLGSTYTDYCKFIIRDNLQSIYQEIYILNKHIGLSSDYIEKLTPIEREIYISSLRKENKSSTEDIPQSSSPVIPQNNSIDNFDEFKQTMGG
jgi:hypothetical protein